MSKHYNPRPSGGSRIFSILGFAFAAILMVGTLRKMGVSLNLPEEERQETVELNPVTADASLESSYKKTEDSNPIYLSESTDVESAPRVYEDKPVRRTRPKGAVLQADSWVERFAETAHQQALNKGVPAGIALAVGINQLEHGAVINSWDDFMNAVIDPLLEIKNTTSKRNVQSYFKYSANSERWAEGLARTGAFSESKLKKILRQYDLVYFDRAVRRTLVEGTAADTETERKASFVADEVANSIRRKKEETTRRIATSGAKPDAEVAENKDLYNEVVGYEVAKEIAKRKLESGDYVSEQDIERLIEETNTETSKAMQNNLGFMGRKINKNHPDAQELLDISKAGNAQARQERYLQKLKELRDGGN